jgi:prepilin-type N-terminal cleavage/methylation domain-containing protein
MAVHRGKGFTLMELLLVVVILGLLAAVAIPRFAQSGSDAKKNACRENIARINSQLELTAISNGGAYPPDQSEFTGKILNDTVLFPDGPPVCPYGTPYTYDTALKRVAPHNH